MSDILSVLVVDDYPPLAKSLAEILQHFGFKAKTAYSGAAALKILRVNPVDILLSDVMMPDMNGVELYRETKKIRPSLTAILMTGFAADDLIQQGFKEGIKTVVDKPVDINFLFMLFSTLQGSKSIAG